MTRDIDSFNSISAPLKKAYEKAKEETGLDIPFSQAHVADAPYSFEDRLIEYSEIKLTKLRVLIPEIHDFILMKTIRGYQHDLEVIEEISKKNKINKDVLTKRFNTEMNQVIGNRKSLGINFAATLSRCFGQAAAEDWLKTLK